MFHPLLFGGLQRASRRTAIAPRPGPLQRVLDGVPVKPRPDDLVPPQREFVILFTPRSGSSHLAQALASAGLADPREWLHPDFLAERAELFGTNSFEDYLGAVRALCSRDGVFGHKMAMTFYDRFSSEARLEDHFDFGAPAIVLYRQDIVQQAVSLALAEQRDFWHDTGGGAPPRPWPAAYDPGAISRSLDWIADQERLTDEFVARKGMPVRYLSYEVLASSPLAVVVEAISDHVGAPADGDAASSDYRKLGGAANVEYAARFVRENPARVRSISARRARFLRRAAEAPLLRTERPAQRGWFAEAIGAWAQALPSKTAPAA